MTLNFFQFWRKTEPKSKLPVSEIPIFSALGPAEVELIESKIRRVEYKKGDIVYRIGEKPEAFYIILLGRFRVIGSKGETITLLAQGDYFGETSILLGRNHSATVEAKNDGLVLKIDKKDFQNLLDEIPSLSLHLSRTLGHRLTVGGGRAGISRTKIIALCDYEIEFQKTAFALNLAALLASQGKKKTILLGLESRSENRFSNQAGEKLLLRDFQVATSDGIQKLIREQKGGFHFLRIGTAAANEGAEAGMAALIGFLVDRYDFILLDLPPEYNDLGVKAIQQSDLIYFLVAEENRSSSKALSFLKEFRTSFGFTTDEIRFILCESKGMSSEESIATILDHSHVSVFSTLPYEEALSSSPSGASEEEDLPFVLLNPSSPYSKAVRFLSRELMGTLVGLALGSGAAFGFAHVGVLKVLEREQIPIDIIAGSSIGALIGAMWASGIDSKALEKVATDLDKKTAFFKLLGFQDISAAHHGFFKGDQLCRFLRNYLDRKTFRMLNLPVKAVACDLFTGEEVVFGEGDAVEAIRASVSIPGIFRPVQWNNQHLIDGGVIDPLPVKVLARYGVKKIIAVNVLSAPADHIQRYKFYMAKKAKFEEIIKKKNWTTRILAFLRLWFEKRFHANIFNVLMNTIQFLEYGIAEASAAGADVLIHPVLPDSHWAEFYSGAKFIRRGEEKAMEQLSEIKRLVEEGS